MRLPGVFGVGCESEGAAVGRGCCFENGGAANATELHVEDGMIVGLRRESIVVIESDRDSD